jgi:hypothetical protein
METQLKPTRIWRTKAGCVFASVLLGLQLMTASFASGPRSVAFMGVHFENDNAMYEPTTEAERKRISNLELQFKKALTDSGEFKVIPLPSELVSKIEVGQPIGSCGGCELDYAASVGAQTVAWINVQKVSNLILNMNVYMADVSQRKMIFVRSVDIRGNTDEMWERSLNYLLKNYLFPKQG